MTPQPPPERPPYSPYDTMQLRALRAEAAEERAVEIDRAFSEAVKVLRGLEARLTEFSFGGTWLECFAPTPEDWIEWRDARAFLAGVSRGTP